MRIGSAIAAFLPLLAALPAGPASAQNYWNCTVHEERDGVRANLTQPYWGPDRPMMVRPVQEVSASAEGTFFFASSYPDWRAIDAPFAPPSQIIVSIRLMERAASHRVSLYAPGAAPMTLRTNIARSQVGEHEVSIRPRDRARIEALLMIPNWTAIIRSPDGRVQQIVPFRMAMTLDRLRAIRDSQIARLREMAHDPARNCDPAEDESAIVAR